MTFTLPRLAVCLLVLPLLLLCLIGCGGGVAPTGNSFFEPVTKVTQYTAFGDSITADVPLTVRSWRAYPATLGPALNLPTADYAYSGDQACDLFPHQIEKNGVAYTATARSLYSVMVGTNDLDHKGTGAYEAVYRNCLDAALTWLGTTRSDKLLTGDEGVHASGGCSLSPEPGHYNGMYCVPGTAGAITVDALFTLGSRPIYVWYSLADQAIAGSSLSASVDGGSATPIPANPPVPMLTQNGTLNSIGVARLSVTAGLHRIVLSTTTGDVAVLGVGSTRSPNAPVLLLGDLPTQLVSNPYASLAAQGQYSSDVIALFFTELGDGLKIYFAADRLDMLGTNAEMADQVHPSALGQQHLAVAFHKAAQLAINYGDLRLSQ